ncbi:hypothetical protein BROUX41_002659 [Berkeleyomyces rouxiae]|uniref:uncharacterized protein n=1 Tax=Berkeleyomyces rouxiae TaxID=2035830 RepID=UPI003B75F160
MGDLGAFLTAHDPNFRSVRIPALYSDFREQRLKAPQSYQEKVDAWRLALCKIAWDGPSPTSAERNRLSVHVNGGLLQRLKTQRFGSPQALGTVVRECLAAKHAYRLADFLQAKQSIYASSLARLPWAALSWACSQVWPAAGAGSAGEDQLETGQFVLVANVAAAFQALSDSVVGLSSKAERTFTKDKFVRRFATELVAGGPLSASDMDVLLVFASRDNSLLAYDGQTVRVRSAEDDSPSVSEEDASIASLKSLIDDLQDQVDLMSRRVETLAAQAKDAVVKKNRVTALAALKSKRLTESALETRYATLHQLEAVMVKLEQAADNVQMVKNMASATAALQSLHAQTGGATRVDDVVQGLRESMADVDEVGAVLADAAPASAAVDEDELDAELLALEADESAKAAADEERATASAREKVRQDLEMARQAVELGKLLDTVSVPADAPAAETTADATEALARMSLEEKQTA